MLNSSQADLVTDMMDATMDTGARSATDMHDNLDLVDEHCNPGLIEDGPCLVDEHSDSDAIDEQDDPSLIDEQDDPDLVDEQDEDNEIRGLDPGLVGLTDDGDDIGDEAASPTRGLGLHLYPQRWH